MAFVAFLAVALVGSAPPVSQPVASASGNLAPGDIPADAILPGKASKVGLELKLDPKGRVTECRVTKSSGDAQSDRLVCLAMLKRAHFKSMKDQSGKPIDGTYNITMDVAPR